MYWKGSYKIKEITGEVPQRLVLKFILYNIFVSSVGVRTRCVFYGICGWHEVAGSANMEEDWIII